jgi:hypothetical protein
MGSQGYKRSRDQKNPLRRLLSINSATLSSVGKDAGEKQLGALPDGVLRACHRMAYRLLRLKNFVVVATLYKHAANEMRSLTQAKKIEAASIW